MTQPAGPITGLTVDPGARRPSLAPASSAPSLLSTHASHQGPVRAKGAGMVHRFTTAEPASVYVADNAAKLGGRSPQGPITRRGTMTGMNPHAFSSPW